jgi:hypothetical protein
MSIKAIITCALIAPVVVLLLFVDRGDSGAGDASWWRGGQGGSVRRLLMHEDGRFRVTTKLMVSLFLLTLAILLWVLVP